MVDMMPDDIPHTDDKAKRKIHPLAKACFIISLVQAALMGCDFGLPLLPESIASPDFWFFAGFMGMVLMVISTCAQPLGILLGICSLVQVRRNHSYCGKRYAIAGITISTFQLAVIGCLYYREALVVWHNFLLRF